MKVTRLLGFVVVSGAAVLSTATESRGQGGKTLTPAQTAAQEAFNEDVKEALEKAKAACGESFKLVTDYENYKDDPWLTDRFVRGNVERARRMAGSTCAMAVGSAAEACTKREESRDAPRGKRKPSKGEEPPKPVKSDIEVKGVTCLFAGAKPKEAGDDTEDLVRKNASFADGILTVHPVVDQANVEQTLWQVLRGKVKSSNLAAGAACERGGQCRSNLCRSNVCITCDEKKNRCPSGFFCDRGMCWNENNGGDEPSSSSSSSGGGGKPKPAASSKKGSGAACKFSSECASGWCRARGGGKSSCN